MATTLTYGRVRPATGDAALTWMAALEGNVTTDDAHTHNGTDSAFLPISSINKSAKTTITAATWSSDGAGNYSATVTVPAAISGAATYNDNYTYNIYAKIATVGASYGRQIYPTITRTSATQFSAVINTNSFDVDFFFV